MTALPGVPEITGALLDVVGGGVPPGSTTLAGSSELDLQPISVVCPTLLYHSCRCASIIHVVYCDHHVI